MGLVDETIGSTVGPDEVTLADIRRKLEVNGLDCPLHVVQLPSGGAE